MAEYRILITGSRNWTDRQTLYGALMDSFGDHEAHEVTVVHGGAFGADSIAGDFAATFGAHVEVHTPDWAACGPECPRRRHRRTGSRGEYCPGAGHRRNQAMVDAGADVCLAFIKAGSRGATHCAEAAENAGIPTKRYTT